MKNSNPPKVSELIISNLIRYGTRTAAELRNDLAAMGKEVTLQAVYLEIAGLINSGAVFKLNRNYLLSLPWIEQQSQRFNVAVNQHMSAIAKIGASKEFQGELIWEPPNLEQFYSLWSALQGVLLGLNRPTKYIEILPIAWFHILGHEFEESRLSIHQKINAQHLLVVHEDTEDVIVRLYRELGSTVFLASALPEILTRTYLSVIGDYVLRASLDDEACKFLNDFLSDVRRGGIKFTDAPRTYFQSPFKIRIHLHKDASKASSITSILNFRLQQAG